ncbi:hypothetical protein GCM10010518_37400 [Kitasatospora cinereorecta]
MGTIDGPVTSTTWNDPRAARPSPGPCVSSGIRGTSRSILQYTAVRAAPRIRPPVLSSPWTFVLSPWGSR